MTIADLLLDFVADAARDHDAESLMPLIDQYVTAIRSARDTIVNADQEAARKAAGYKDLEIAISLQKRRLQAIRGISTIDDRPPFKHALSAKNSIKKKIIPFMF